MTMKEMRVIKHAVLLHAPIAPGGIFSVKDPEHKILETLFECKDAELYLCAKNENDKPCYVLQGVTGDDFEEIASVYNTALAAYDSFTKELSSFVSGDSEELPEISLLNDYRDYSRLKAEVLPVLGYTPEYFWVTMVDELDKIMSNYKEGDNDSQIKAMMKLYNNWLKVNDLIEKYPMLEEDEVGQAAYVELYDKYKQTLLSTGNYWELRISQLRVALGNQDIRGCANLDSEVGDDLFRNPSLLGDGDGKSEFDKLLKKIYGEEPYK